MKRRISGEIYATDTVATTKARRWSLRSEQDVALIPVYGPSAPSSAPGAHRDFTIDKKWWITSSTQIILIPQLRGNKSSSKPAFFKKYTQV